MITGRRKHTTRGRAAQQGDDMFHIDIEKPKLNPVHFIAIIGTGIVVIVVNTFAAAAIWFNLLGSIDAVRNTNNELSKALAATQAELSARFDKEAQDRKDRQAVYQKALDTMNTQIGQIQPLQFQQSRLIEQLTETRTEARTSSEATNKRMDRVVDSFNGKVDTLIDGMNKLTTAVEVLRTTVKEGQTEKTKFQQPVMRGPK